MALTGLVTKAHSGFFTVHLDHDGRTLVCTAAGRLTNQKFESDALAVGDRVTVEDVASEGHSSGRVIARADRKLVLSRMDPIANTNQREIQQVIVANLDLCLFVFACADPKFAPRMLDRYLVGAEAQKLPAIIVATKVDLLGHAAAHALFKDYERIGYQVIYVSKKFEQDLTTPVTNPLDGYGVREVRVALQDKISVLTGKSGAGKSSLLNAMKPGLAQEVGEVSELLRKGKHTTVAPQLFQIDEHSWIADTPGLRGYAVWDVDDRELDGYFRDIAPLVSGCAYSNCTHTHEAKCAVRRAVASGALSAERYASFLKLREELAGHKRW